MNSRDPHKGRNIFCQLIANSSVIGYYSSCFGSNILGKSSYCYYIGWSIGYSCKLHLSKNSLENTLSNKYHQRIKKNNLESFKFGKRVLHSLFGAQIQEGNWRRWSWNSWSTERGHNRQNIDRMYWCLTLLHNYQSYWGKYLDSKDILHYSYYIEHH